MKKWIYNTLIVIFALVFLGSAGYLAYYFINSRIQEQSYNELSQIMESNTVAPRPTINEESTGPNDSVTEPTLPPLVDAIDPETGKTVQLLPQFKELYERNNDMVGWMTIPGTEINYPVMQTPDQVDYYLKHNFEKESSAHGALYAREVCDINKPSDNITIYGHRMRDGSMFARLDLFMEKSFWESNPYIYFDTLTEQHTYKIMAVFLTTATLGEGFSYHKFVDAQNEAEFDQFVNTCKNLALYDTGVDAQYGDKFITLSTCEYSQANGRLVVVAKRIG